MLRDIKLILCVWIGPGERMYDIVYGYPGGIPCGTEGICHAAFIEKLVACLSDIIASINALISALRTSRSKHF